MKNLYINHVRNLNTKKIITTKISLNCEEYLSVILHTYIKTNYDNCNLCRKCDVMNSGIRPFSSNTLPKSIANELLRCK